MKADKNGIQKLSKEESAFIKELMLKNDTLIRNVLKGVFAEKYVQLTDECIGETWLLVCERAKLLMAHPNPDGWVVKAAKTKALECLRKYGDPRILPLEEAINLNAGQSVEDEAQYNIWKERFYISEVLGCLSKREKQIYRLLYIEKLSVTDAAALLGISEKTLFNARRIMTEKVKKLLFE